MYHRMRSKGASWAGPRHIIFYLKQQDLQHKAGLVVGGHVVDSTEHTTYLPTIKDMSVRLIILIAVKNGLVLMAGDVGNALCTSSCA